MKRNVFARRAASAALAACMMFTLSAPALAAGTDALLQQSTAAKSAVSVLDEENNMMEEEVAQQMNLSKGSITVYIGDNGKQYAKQGEGTARQIGNLTITTNNSETNNILTINGGSVSAKVTLENVNINASGAAVSVSGDVELNIAGTNTLRSGEKHAGLEKADDDGTLTIDGTGELNAYGGSWAAGIGSRAVSYVRNIVINGGIINAKCTGDFGSGIGGSWYGKAENIRINGGVVTATGGRAGVGIGGGCDDASTLPTTITITGGTVKAIAGNPGVAIGMLENADALTMTGGSLTVQRSDADHVWIENLNFQEVDKSWLTGLVIYLDENGNEVVRDYGIEVGSENTTPTRVTSKNYKDILEDGILCYDIEEKTLKLNDGKFFNGSLTITAPENVSIDLEADASHVVNGNLTVNGAKDVKVTKLASGDAAAAIEGKAEISCSGDVILKNLGGEFSSGRNLIKNGLTVKRADTVTTEGLISDETIIDCTGNIKLGNEWGTTVSKLTVKSADNVTVTSGSWYRSIGQGAEIKCSGTVKISGTSPIEGDVKIDAGKDVSLEYVGNHNVIDIKAAGKVELNSDSDSNLGKVIFTQADNKPYVYFTEKSSSEFKDFRITPIPETVESSYLRIEPRETYDVTVKNGTVQVGDDTTGLTTAFEGEKVIVRANKLPDGVAEGTKFYGWEVAKDSTAFTLTEGKLGTEEEAGTEEIRFDMPKGNVKLTACWSASPVAEPDPDKPFDEGFAVAPTPMDTTGGAIAAVAVGGAAILGGYEITTRVILHNLLPEGAAIPANRGQLALLVWNTAGRPEPAGTPAFVDVADPDMAKAAQWCTEQGIMDAKGDRFEPEGWTPKFKVIDVWNKAFPKQ